MKVYTIYDRVAKEAGPLFTAKNDDVAVRNFNQLMKTERVEKPSEYLLYCLGDYDVEEPMLFGDKVPTILNTSEDDDE